MKICPTEQLFCLPECQKAVPEGWNVILAGKEGIPEGGIVIPEGKKAIAEEQIAIPESQKRIPEGGKVIRKDQIAVREGSGAQSPQVAWQRAGISAQASGAWPAPASLSGTGLAAPMTVPPRRAARSSLK